MPISEDTKKDQTHQTLSMVLLPGLWQTMQVKQYVSSPSQLSIMCFCNVSPRDNQTAHTTRRAHADVPMHDNCQRQHFTNNPSASSKNVKAAAVNPCVDGDFPNVDFNDDDLVSAVATPHTPDEKFGLVLVPNGTNHAEHAKSDCDLNLILFSREESVMVDLLMTLKSCVPQ